jgi:hypothetical protein
MDYEVLAATGWGSLGNELQKAGLVDEFWYKKPNRVIKNTPTIDRELLELFLSLEKWVLRDGVKTAEDRANQVRSYIERIDEEQSSRINTILFALHLIRFWAENTKGPLAKQIGSKALRLIDETKKHVIEKSGLETSVNSYRCADDILRIVEGRAVLPKEVRDAVASKYIKRRTKS